MYQVCLIDLERGDFQPKMNTIIAFQTQFSFKLDP